jgi:hypothetical protein
MKRHAAAAFALALAVVSAATGPAARAQQARAPLPLEPLGTTDEAIFPAFEGWGPLQDGERVFLLGYFNRNKREPIDVAIGPDNRIEPGGPDHGQPTHFETGRQYGVFAIRVPKDLGTNKLTWTLTANGQTSVVSFWVNQAYYLDFFKHHANGNRPPIIRFAADGPTTTGPPRGFVQTLSGTVGVPIALKLWASDPPQLMADIEDELAARNNTSGRGSAGGPAAVAVIGSQVLSGAGRGGKAVAERTTADITVKWRTHRGPGRVTFAPEQIPLVTGGDPTRFLEATATATFDTPGEYVLRAQVNDSSGDGGGGLQCCWTTAHVKVNVR